MDIASKFDGAIYAADLAMDGRLLQEDGTIETGIIISLFSNRRANPDDELPVGVRDRGGFWADALPSVSDETARTDRLGSRLWLLSREKQTQETLNKARGFIEEALAWTIEDGHFTRVDVETAWLRTGVLGFGVIGYFADGSVYRQKFIMNLTGA